MGDLSQQDRVERVRSVNFFDAIDGSVDSLLRQAETIAAFVRYYTPKGAAGGHFDQFLQDLAAIRKQGAENFAPDGNLEPAQALLFTFVTLLHEIANNFNLKWKDYAYRYLQRMLGAQSLPVENHKICLHFTKNVSDAVALKKNQELRLASSDANAPAYRLNEDFAIENTSIEKAISVHFNREKKIKPASKYNFVTALQIKKLSANDFVEEPLFAHDSKPEYTHPLGFMLTSPSLLLREGKRSVTIMLERDNTKGKGENLKISLEEWERKLTEKKSRVKYLHNIFYIRISTASGWKMIENYAVKREGDNLLLKFTLLEDFSATAPCRQDIHSFQSDFPTLRIYLNYDAWLYPYSWLRYFPLKKIHIKTEVEGINNILIYNDLGKVDCSKPFQPFGINTEKGALMVIGNYEMSVKHTRRLDVKIRWGGLPTHLRGLQEHYAGYGVPIDNASFKVQAYYLADYQWNEEGEYALFGVDPGAPLSKETALSGINVEKMPVKWLAEAEYDYTIHSQAGFVSFMLQSPEMGFGEKQYRKVFSEYIMQEAQPKKGSGRKQKSAPNEPYKPVIERIALDYVAEETVDLRRQPQALSSAFYHISPFGDRQVYPSGGGNPYAFLVFQMDTDANVLIAMRNLRKGGVLNLYFDFLPFRKEINLDEIPQVKWFFGDGYRWEILPDGYVGLDKTTNLLESGFLRIFVPEDLEDTLFDENGIIWLRAAVEKNENVIPYIKNIYINVAEAEVEMEKWQDSAHSPLALAGTQWKSEENISGISEIRAAASYSGKEKESEEQRLMRLSEYASHRGKAVTARDYERMTLQEFPDIGKVKCLPAFSAKTDKKEDVTLVILPQQQEKSSKKYLATSRQILKVEEFFAERTSAAVRFVDAINPLYEEALVRCRVAFKKRYPAASCRTCLSDLLNNLIAPWQQSGELPEFDYSLDMEAIRQRMLEQEFVSAVEELSVVVISEVAENSYTLHEHGKDDSIISPSTPFAIFIPAKEHLITANTDIDFGISEMAIEDSFVIA
ncbi:MAG: hypothetical protein LBF55_04190 [Prevotellaceae bacterium]|jgi:hypothetical protein|nr:hypothetical protein [Prevotellaceae bacterium]